MSRSILLAYVALLLYGGMALAARGQDRSSDQVLSEIQKAELPKLDQAKMNDRDAVMAFIVERRKVADLRAKLIGELYKVDPKNAKLVELLPERWMMLAQQQKPTSPNPELKAELEAAMAPSGNEKLRIEATFIVAAIALSSQDGAPQEKLRKVDDFIQLAPKDPRGADLFFAAAARSNSTKERTELYQKLVQAYPDTPFAEMAKGTLKRQEGIGKPFELEFTEAIKGTAITMKDLHGKVVVIDFWATWCGPCVAEMPKMKALYAKYREKGVEFIGVSLDQTEGEGGLKALKEFVAKNEITWPQYYQGNGWESAFSKSWGVNSIPCVFVVDKEGNLYSVEARGKLEKMIPELLGEEEAEVEPPITPTGKNVSAFDYWAYDKDERGQKGFFKKEEGKRWVEMKDGKVWSHFEEAKRTPDFIALYDEGRSLSLRLYDGSTFWKTDSENEWHPLPFAAVGREKEESR